MNVARFFVVCWLGLRGSASLHKSLLLKVLGILGTELNRILISGIYLIGQKDSKFSLRASGAFIEQKEASPHPFHFCAFFGDTAIG